MVTLYEGFANITNKLIGEQGPGFRLEPQYLKVFGLPEGATQYLCDRLNREIRLDGRLSASIVEHLAARDNRGIPYPFRRDQYVTVAAIDPKSNPHCPSPPAVGSVGVIQANPDVPLGFVTVLFPKGYQDTYGGSPGSDALVVHLRPDFLDREGEPPTRRQIIARLKDVHIQTKLLVAETESDLDESPFPKEPEWATQPIPDGFTEGQKVRVKAIDPKWQRACAPHPAIGTVGTVIPERVPVGKVCVSFDGDVPLDNGATMLDCGDPLRLFFRVEFVEVVS